MQGLVCTYVVAKEPADKKTTDRAVPIAIFQAEPAVSMTYLKRWCKNIQTIGAPTCCASEWPLLARAKPRYQC